jgi:hypothetical protein
MIPLFTYFTWDASNTEYMLGIVGDVFSDLSVLIGSLVAVGLALLVIEGIVWAVRKH